MGSVMKITVDELFSAIENPLDAVTSRFHGLTFKLSVSPQFLAAFLAEKNRRSGDSLVIPYDRLATLAETLESEFHTIAPN